MFAGNQLLTGLNNYLNSFILNIYIKKIWLKHSDGTYKIFSFIYKLSNELDCPKPVSEE